MVSWEEDSPSEPPGERPRDRKIDEAKKLVLRFLSDNEGVFYIKQLQVLLEENFYHWIVGRAVGELIDDDAIGSQEVARKNGKAVFVFRKALRYRQRRIKKAVQVIEKFSAQEVARGCGESAENLFLVAFMAHGFAFASTDISEQRNTRKYAGKVWAATNHELDFIIARDGIAYGAEVKNTWDYIPRNEMRMKQLMCRFLGVKPLFIWRFAPKNYMWEIIKGGGYGMIFKTHIFPSTHKALVEEIKSVLDLDCDCPRRIPDGILQKFVSWHKRSVRV